MKKCKHQWACSCTNETGTIVTISEFFNGVYKIISEIYL